MGQEEGTLSLSWTTRVRAAVTASVKPGIWVAQKAMSVSPIIVVPLLIR
jgi:hypothetical protein